MFTDVGLGVRNEDRHALMNSHTVCIDCKTACSPEKWCLCCQPVLVVSETVIERLPIAPELAIRIISAGGCRLEVEEEN